MESRHSTFLDVVITISFQNALVALIEMYNIFSPKLQHIDISKPAIT